jgi:hypothetical protein
MLRIVKDAGTFGWANAGWPTKDGRKIHGAWRTLWSLHHRGLVSINYDQAAWKRQVKITPEGEAVLAASSGQGGTP